MKEIFIRKEGERKMNWLDVILIVINAGLIIFGIISIIFAIKDNYSGWREISAIFWICYVFFGLILLLPFIVIDKGSGSTIGTITSVDKNFFGTTALYIKTSETTQEKYCIEFDEQLENKAKELIGKKVKIEYGERVGLYSTSKCSQAPVEYIEKVEQ